MADEFEPYDDPTLKEYPDISTIERSKAVRMYDR
jgi:hypothetical protein